VEAAAIMVASIEVAPSIVVVPSIEVAPSIEVVPPTEVAPLAEAEEFVLLTIVAADAVVDVFADT
jgi:hypothetical protein